MMNRTRLKVCLWLSLTIIAPSVSLAGGNPALLQNMDEACGNAVDSVASEPKGRWLPWSEDHFDKEKMSPKFIRKEHDMLIVLAQPFMHLPILSAPPGVEVRAQRSMNWKKSMDETRKDYEAGKKEQAANQGGMTEAQQKALIDQIRQTDPKAAKDMEKQFAQMRKMMAEQMPRLRKQADTDFAGMGDKINLVIQKFKDELAAMSPAERASAAYIGGLQHSEVSGHQRS